jgi:hypothetical protein
MDDRRRAATEHMRETLARARPAEAKILMAEAVKRGAISEKDCRFVDGKMSSDTVHKLAADISRLDDKQSK